MAGLARAQPLSEPPLPAPVTPPTFDPRRGFRAGAGLTGLAGMDTRSTAFVAGGSLDFHFDWSFGLIGLRASPRLFLESANDRWIAFGGAVDTQLHVNLGKIFALRAGVELGAFPTEGSGIFFFAPTFGVVFKFGTRSQFQLGLGVEAPVTGQPMVGALSLAYLFGADPPPRVDPAPQVVAPPPLTLVSMAKTQAPLVVKAEPLSERQREAKAMLSAIGAAVRAFHQQNGKLPRPIDSSPHGDCCAMPGKQCEVTQANFSAWRSLGLKADDRLRYHYELTVTPYGFIARATGNPMCTDATEVWEVRGTIISKDRQLIISEPTQTL